MDRSDLVEPFKGVERTGAIVDGHRWPADPWDEAIGRVDRPPRSFDRLKREFNRGLNPLILA